MSKLIFEAKGQGAATVQGSERFRMLAVIKSEGERLGIEADRGGAALEPFELMSVPQANRCLRAGTDSLRLVARLAAQADMHCWVDGPNRAWLEKLIGEGLAAGYFRPRMGWDTVRAFLLVSDTEPVYVSSSISGPMPSPDLAKRSGLVTEEELEELLERDPATLWDLSEYTLRAESSFEDEALRPGSDLTAPFSRELRPTNWPDYFFAY